MSLKCRARLLKEVKRLKTKLDESFPDTSFSEYEVSNAQKHDDHSEDEMKRKKESSNQQEEGKKR